jgi:hypothetical protein
MYKRADYMFTISGDCLSDSRESSFVATIFIV